MIKKNSPKKPSSPLGHIVFPAKGAVYKVIERLPERKEDLERTIVDRFVGALAHFEGRYIEAITKTDPWPDFEGQESKNQLGIMDPGI